MVQYLHKAEVRRFLAKRTAALVGRQFAYLRGDLYQPVALRISLDRTPILELHRAVVLFNAAVTCERIASGD